MAVRLVEVALFIPLVQAVVSKTWTVTLPKSIVGLSGSCITIPCRFDAPESAEKHVTACSEQSVTWKKGRSDGLSVYSGRSLDTNQIQGRVIGDVARKECTTLLHSFPPNGSDVYFLRLECHETQITFSETVNILAQPEPPPPMLTPVTQVPEGAQVRLQCSVPVPCPTLSPSITWLLGNNSIQGQNQKQHVTFMVKQDEPMTMTSLLTFNASAQHHNLRVTCIASYPLTTGGRKQSRTTTQPLDIQYGPRSTEATLRKSDQSVMLTCSSDANPPVDSYTWYRVRTGTNDLMKIAKGQYLVLTISHGGGAYLCEAQSRRGSQRSRPVSLPTSGASESNKSSLLGLYIICATLLLLLLLHVIVDVRKYRSFSKRLKQMEQRDEHMYANLRPPRAASVYDQLQLPKTAPQRNDADYVLPN